MACGGPCGSGTGDDRLDMRVALRVGVWLLDVTIANLYHGARKPQHARQPISAATPIPVLPVYHRST